MALELITNILGVLYLENKINYEFFMDADEAIEIRDTDEYIAFMVANIGGYY